MMANQSFDNFNVTDRIIDSNDDLLGFFGSDDGDLLGGLKKYQNSEFFELEEIAYDIQKYYLIVLAVIGVPTNALTVATILSMHALSPATFFVALLAVFDGCALIVKLMGNQLKGHEVSHNDMFCKVMESLSIFFSTTANWVLVLICLERFVSVCYPLKKAYLFTKKRSFITAAILTGVLFFLIVGGLGMMRVHLNGSCTTAKRFIWTYSNVWLYVNAALHLFIPFSLIAILTAFIIHGLRKSRKHRVSLMRKNEENMEEMKILEGGAHYSGASKKSKSMSTPVTPTALHNQKMLDDTARVERTITLMLIAAGGIFLVLSLPISLYYLIKGLSRPTEMSVENARWNLYRVIAYIFIDSSHAVNFFLYFFTAKRFRVQLLRVVTGRASCWGRKISQRGRKAGSGGYQANNRRTSKSTASCTTTSTDLAASGPRGSTVHFPPSSV